MPMANTRDICVKWKPARHDADRNVTGVYAIDFGDRPEDEWIEYPAGDDTDAEFNRVVGRILTARFPKLSVIAVSRCVSAVWRSSKIDLKPVRASRDEAKNC
jgi:hypothetical protein